MIKWLKNKRDAILVDAIGGLVTALVVFVVGVVWLWAKSDFSWHPAIAWAAAKSALYAAWAWLAGSIGLPRGLILAALVVLTAGVATLIRKIKKAHAMQVKELNLRLQSFDNQHLMEVRSRSIDVTRLTAERIAVEEELRTTTESFIQADRARSNLIDELVALKDRVSILTAERNSADVNFRNMEQKYTEVDQARNELVAQLDRLSNPPDKNENEAEPDDAYGLSDLQLRIIKTFFSNYTTRFSAQAIAGALRISHPAAEREVDALVDKELLKYVVGGYSSDSGFVLTEEGRDYCLDRHL